MFSEEKSINPLVEFPVDGAKEFYLVEKEH